MKTKYFYDLDGTLSSLNSTFDFIEGYLKYNKQFLKLYTAKLAMVILFRSRLYNPYKWRGHLILLLFRGLTKKDLERYFEEIYLPHFLDSLSPLGHQLMNKTKKPDVLLTGCTEIPAKMIGELFGFKEVISTEFILKNGKVCGIATDTYGNNKRKFVSKSEQQMVYFTDDLNSEMALVGIMDEIVEVQKIFKPSKLEKVA